MSDSRIPIVDARMIYSDRPRFVREFGDAFKRTGFAKLANTRVPMDLITQSRLTTKQVFSHPDEILKEWERPLIGRAVGFTPFQVEHSRDTPQEQGDLKRFWHVRGPKQPFVNLFPDRLVPAFGPTMRDLYDHLEAFAFDLLLCLEEYLDLPHGTLCEMAEAGHTLLRVLDYPKVGGVGANGAVRSGQHTDINLITLLIPATARGLQVQALDGTWFDANENPDEIVVNVGDMLQLLLGGLLDEKWTVHGGRLTSTWHRVVNPGEGEIDEGRNSFPMFVHPRGTIVLNEEYGIMANHYLFQRLVEIGLLDSAIRDAFFAEHPLRRPMGKRGMLGTFSV